MRSPLLGREWLGAKFVYLFRRGGWGLRVWILGIERLLLNIFGFFVLARFPHGRVGFTLICCGGEVFGRSLVLQIALGVGVRSWSFVLGPGGG